MLGAIKIEFLIMWQSPKMLIMVPFKKKYRINTLGSKINVHYNIT